VVHGAGEHAVCEEETATAVVIVDAPGEGDVFEEVVFDGGVSSDSAVGVAGEEEELAVGEGAGVAGPVDAFEGVHSDEVERGDGLGDAFEGVEGAEGAEETEQGDVAVGGEGNGGGKEVGMEDGVGVGEEEVVAGSALGAEMCGVAFPGPVVGAGIVFNEGDAGILRGVGAEDGSGVVGAAVEDEDDLQRVVVLVCERGGAGVDDVLFVMDGDDDGDLGSRRGAG